MACVSETDLRGVSLVLVSHGSRGRDRSGEMGRTLADEIARGGWFRRVVHRTWTDGIRPLSAEAAEWADDSPVFVLPCLIDHGVLCDQLFPARLELAAERTFPVVYGLPLGRHRSVGGMLWRQALSQAAAPWRQSLVLVGHGSRGMGGAVDAMADRMRGHGVFADVRAAYVEGIPSLTRWPELVGGDEALLMPVFLEGGNHVRDLPALARQGGGRDRPFRLLRWIPEPNRLARLVVGMARAAMVRPKGGAS